MIPKFCDVATASLSSSKGLNRTCAHQIATALFSSARLDGLSLMPSTCLEHAARTEKPWNGVRSGAIVSRNDGRCDAAWYTPGSVPLKSGSKGGSNRDRLDGSERAVGWWCRGREKSGKEAGEEGSMECTWIGVTWTCHGGKRLGGDERQKRKEKRWTGKTVHRTTTQTVSVRMWSDPNLEQRSWPVPKPQLHVNVFAKTQLRHVRILRPSKGTRNVRSARS